MECFDSGLLVSIGRAAMIAVKNLAHFSPETVQVVTIFAVYCSHTHGRLLHFLKDSTPIKHIVPGQINKIYLSRYRILFRRRCTWSFRGHRLNQLGWGMLIFPLVVAVHFPYRMFFPTVWPQITNDNENESNFSLSFFDFVMPFPNTAPETWIFLSSGPHCSVPWIQLAVNHVQLTGCSIL